MSAKFCRDAYNHTKIIILHGVPRKSGRGFPESIMQEELHNIKEQEKVRGTVISADLVGNSKCAHILFLCMFTIINLFISFQWNKSISNGQRRK